MLRVLLSEEEEESNAPMKSRALRLLRPLGAIVVSVAVLVRVSL